MVDPLTATGVSDHNPATEHPGLTEDAAYYAAGAVEPVLEVLKPGYAWVVENRYGAEVLVTHRSHHNLPMVDIDEPCSLPELSIRLLQLELHKLLQLRCYRTSGGWRLLVASTSLDPAGPLFELLHNGMGGDPRYLKLCRQQKSFRARLTPKPWRVSDLEEETRVCSFAGSIGAAEYDPWLMELVEYHDARTGAVLEGHPLG
jgi:hypothetical protein